jgi:hypothetical protein
VNIENSSHYEEDCDYEKAKDLRIDKRATINRCVGGSSNNDDDRHRADSDGAAKIKQEPFSELHSTSSNVSRLAARR